MASTGKSMSDVHVTTAGVVFHSGGSPDLPKGTGQPVTVIKDASGKVVATSGQVPGSSVIHTNPA